MDPAARGAGSGDRARRGRLAGGGGGALRGPAAPREPPAHLAVRLHGRKLRGGFALTRTGPERWVLAKMRDDFAEAERDVVAEEPRSVVSGRTLAEVDAGP